MVELVSETREFKIDEEKGLIIVTKTTTESFSAEEYVRETTGIEFQLDRSKLVVDETEKILAEFKVNLEKAEELKQKKKEQIKAEVKAATK